MNAGDYWLGAARAMYVLGLFLLCYLTLTLAAGEQQPDQDDDTEQLPQDDPRVALGPLLVLVLFAPLGMLL